VKNTKANTISRGENLRKQGGKRKTLFSGVLILERFGHEKKKEDGKLTSLTFTNSKGATTAGGKNQLKK